MENKKLYLYAENIDVIDDSPLCPYPPIERNAVIEKDQITNKFHFIDFGLRDTPWRKEHIFETFDEAFDFFYNYKMGFYLFEINQIEPGIKYFYTKKLIEKLNLDQYDKIKEIPIKSFKKNLGVEIMLIKNPNDKGIRIINLIKNQNTNNEMKYFFVGKLGYEGSVITIKNMRDEVIFLTSSDNITIETEEIKNNIYWYFQK